MKIAIIMNENETKAISTSIYSIGKDVSRAKTKKFVDEMDAGFSIMHGNKSYHREFAGMQTFVGNDEVCIDIAEGATIYWLNAAAKLANIIAPALVTMYGLAGMIKNAGTQLKDAFKGICQEYDNKFGRTPTYSYGFVMVEEIDLYDAVVIEDDGFGNRHLVYANHLGKVHTPATIFAAYMKAYARDRRTEDARRELEAKNASFYEMEHSGAYQPIYTETFKAITKEAAIEAADNKADSMRSDSRNEETDL
jgi:hypothetical protein